MKLMYVNQIENILNQDPHVQSSVMFGRGKFYAGVVVDPKPNLRFNPSDTAALVGFRQKIWYVGFAMID